ncbi:MAG: DUF2062 domain-containing protein [Mangrovibacterium sp.]
MSGSGDFGYKGLMPRLYGLKRWLVQPASPRKMAWSFLFGFYLGLFPVVGAATALCLLFTFLFRLNPLIVQAVNFALFPLQVALIYPFMKAGRLLFFGSNEVLPAVSVGQFMAAEGWQHVIYLSKSVAGGILVWFLFSLTTGYFLYRFLMWLVRNSLPAENPA